MSEEGWLGTDVPKVAGGPPGDELLHEALQVFAAGGWQVHVAERPEEAMELVARLAVDAGLTSLHERFLVAELGLARMLAERGLQVVVVGREGSGRRDPEAAAEIRARLCSAGLGVTGASALVAETGTLLLAEEDGYGRLVSNLPPVHVALARRSQLVARLDEGLAAVRAGARAGAGFPRYLSGISGPSKTGDIDMEIVRGMHGPGVVHLVILL